MLTRAMAKELSVASAHECLFVDFLSKEEPKKVSEALKHPGWVNAMQEELNQFSRNKVWTLVPPPYGKTIIGSKSIFRNKRDETGILIKNKTRLVAQGYRQEEGIDYDETFSPASILEAIRIFLSFATYMNFTRHKTLKQFAKLVTQKYEMSMMGVLTNFLGFQIKQSERGICINQENYVKDLLKKYDINGFDLKGYSDSDYHGCNIDNKSTLGASEYVAVAGCCANILCMKSQLSDYDIVLENVPIFCDNTSAITISNNSVLHTITKHIDIKYHFTLSEIIS
ncbi:retrovirus-related pol polyprotein from transposon TNT 1-94 [Tanacetum coccineum]